jgi:hypothetical protein
LKEEGDFMKKQTRCKTKKMIFCAAVVCLAAVQITAAVPAKALGISDISTSLAASAVNEVKTTIAPGLTQKEFFYKGSDGRRQACFSLEYKPKDLDISLAAGTPRDGSMIGLATVKEQANAAISNGKNVVAAINSDMYNMKTGDPWGVVVKDGNEIHSYAPVRTWWKFFGIKKDGTPIYGDRQTYTSNKGQIQQAMGIHSILVEKGEIVNPDKTSTTAPRLAVGVRNDQSVFFVMNDGRKAPYSYGMTLEQTAQLMKDMGAVWAGNMDGGGSATFLTRTPGEKGMNIKNYLSDGRERRVANTWLFLSNWKSDGKFASAYITPYDKSYLPGSVVQMSAKGVDSSGTPVKLPESGLSWALSDSSFGTIDQTGLFASNGSVGQVQVQLLYNGTPVGSTYIEIANPDDYVPVGTFTASPGGEGLAAAYQGREVVLTMRR